jgi:hypothetical protein
MNADGSYTIDYGKLSEDRGVYDEEEFSAWLESLEKVSEQMAGFEE